MAASEARWLDRQIDALNNVTERSVKIVQSLYPSVDIQFVNVNDYFPRGACRLESKSRRFINKIKNSIIRYYYKSPTPAFIPHKKATM